MDPPQETPSPGCWDRGLGSQFPTGYEVGRECILSHESEFTATGIWQLTSRPSYEGFGCRPWAEECLHARKRPAFETLPRRKPRDGRAPMWRARSMGIGGSRAVGVERELLSDWTVEGRVSCRWRD